MTVEHAAEGFRALEVEFPNGALEVRAVADAGAVRGNGEVWARGATPEAAREALDRVRWVWEERGDVLVLRLEGAEHVDGGGDLLPLEVPVGWALTVEAANGRVEVGPGFAPGVVHLTNGRVEAAPDGDFTYDGSNGRVRLRLPAGWDHHAEVALTNGVVEVECDGTLDASVHPNVTNGTYEGPDPEPEGAGRLDLSVTNGRIQVRRSGG